MRSSIRSATLRLGRGVRFGAAAATLGAVGWYYAKRVHEEAFLVRPPPPPRQLKTLAVGEDYLAIARSPGADEHQGIWGVRGPAGYAQIGAVLEQDEQRLVRRFAALDGRIDPGHVLQLDNFAFPADPARALGVPYREVYVETSGRTFPAWELPGQGETWLVLVHGKGSERGEALRLLSGLLPRHPPALVITYRNDAAAVANDDTNGARYAYGLDEWADLEAAVAYAQARGARHVVLVGYSMGGAIVANFLARSRLADAVAGVILDSPMLDLNTVLDHAAAQRRLPSVVTDLARRILRRRYGIDCDEFGCWGAIATSERPLLLIHGESDPLVPVASSDKLAQMHTGDLTYHRVPHAHHVGSWNLDPAGYARAVARFLRSMPGVSDGLAPASRETGTDRAGLWLD